MNSEEVTLQVYHRHFKIPVETYLNSVTDYLDPWEERAYQHFVEQFLKTTHDNGIVGMVRQENDKDYVYLDAAVRYPINHQIDLEKAGD
ncbi:hypothetical protein Desaci_1814 [Desulfosporosinus acidiphilus SJ4]|uniref:Uncharacterized protein n=1 Tax=Desulfosporosinus acidiphilus (strain DSM 22704 / JCM 16185 / SJ4) TaxID=646529 RepID=I4D4S7_DESAJ|nr:hypothetical protein [Desulfosporosinus acidiphilus]AFM40801.1 hypothetical protein Desaci_1814 [Desulfosporosinus acidiphilus SJ4]